MQAASPAPRAVPRSARVRIVAAVAVMLAWVGVLTAFEAEHGRAQGATGGTQVYGRVAGPGNTSVRVHVGLFTRGWTWLRNVTSGPGGVYKMNHVKPGRYWLQISDARPRWNVDSFATKDVKLTVGHQVGMERDVILKRGSFITGTVRVGHGSGSPAKRPTLIAAAPGGASFTVTGNSAGQFALGGLPAGDYSLFAYDNQDRWSGRSVWIGGLKAGSGTNVGVRLATRAAAYGGFLKVGQKLMTGTVWVTAVSRTTGQFWVEQVHHGDLGTLKGLYPGRYTLHIPATATTRARKVELPRVAAGHTRTVSIELQAKPAPAPSPSPTTSPSPVASSSPTTSPSPSIPASPSATP